MQFTLDGGTEFSTLTLTLDGNVTATVLGVTVPLDAVTAAGWVALSGEALFVDEHGDTAVTFVQRATGAGGPDAVAAVCHALIAAGRASWAAQVASVVAAAWDARPVLQPWASALEGALGG